MALPTPSRRGSATRERLLLAARDLFASRGYHATTTALLAERIGAAEGTIYRHFAGKDALYSAVHRATWERFAALVGEPPGPRDTARECLAAAAHRLAAEAARAPAAVRLDARALELSALDEPARRARERLREAITQLVAAGKQEGAVRAGSAELWASLWTAVIREACLRVAEGEWTPDHTNVGLAIEGAWDLIRKQETGNRKQE